METETAVETQTGAADEAQPTGGDENSADTHQEGGEAAQSGRKSSSTDSGASEGARLNELLERQKDPNVVFEDHELDLLEKYDFGRLKPKDDAKKDPADADGQDDDPDKGEDEPQPDDKPKGKVDPDLEAALKEVGAKTPKELRTKIKELRQQLTGRDAQTNVQLRKDLETLGKRVQSEESLWKDVKSGNPEAVAKALAHVNTVYGLKLSVDGQAGAMPAGRSAEAASDFDPDLEEVIPKELFVDEESHKKTNGFIRSLAQVVKELKGQVGDVQAEKARNRESTARQEAQTGTIDEMMQIAGMKGMESIAKIPNLRQAITRWYAQGEENPALEVLQKVLDKGNEFDIPLPVAFNILRGEGYDFDVAVAENRGRDSAFNQKPSRSLSGMQGKGQEQYQKYSDEALKEMAEDFTKAPPNWFTDDDKPNHETIPRRAWKYFFSAEEIAAFK